MKSESPKAVEWVPLANGNADALFAFEVSHAISDPHHDMSRKVIDKIPTLAVQCLTCGRINPFAGLLTGCPRCSRTDYLYQGTPSKLGIICGYCSAGILNSVTCICGSSNRINGQALRQPRSGGCFIATAAYESPIAPEVVVIRDFRDRILLRSEMCSRFVRFYYALSPPLALLISKSGLLRAVIRVVLLRPILRVVREKV